MAAMGQRSHHPRPFLLRSWTFRAILPFDKSESSGTGQRDRNLEVSSRALEIIPWVTFHVKILKYCLLAWPHLTSSQMKDAFREKAVATGMAPKW